MKQLLPGAVPWTPERQPTWVVFAAITKPMTGNKRVLQLTEVARVPAGSAPAAIQSAVEDGQDRTPGERVAIPEEMLRPRKIRIGLFAVFE